MEPDASVHWIRGLNVTVVAALETSVEHGPTFVGGTAAGDVYIGTLSGTVKLGNGDGPPRAVTAIATAPSGRAVVVARTNTITISLFPQDGTLAPTRKHVIEQLFSDTPPGAAVAVTAVAVCETGAGTGTDQWMFVAFGTECGRVGMFLITGAFGNTTVHRMPELPSFSRYAEMFQRNIGSKSRALVFVTKDDAPMLVALSDRHCIVEYTCPGPIGCDVTRLRRTRWHTQYVEFDFGCDISAIAQDRRRGVFVGIGDCGVICFTHTTGKGCDGNAADDQWRADVYARAPICDECGGGGGGGRNLIAVRPDGAGIVSVAQCGHVVCLTGDMRVRTDAPARTMPAPGATGIVCTSADSVLCLFGDGSLCGWTTAPVPVSAPSALAPAPDTAQVEPRQQPRVPAVDDVNATDAFSRPNGTTGVLPPPSQNECIVCMNAAIDTLLLPCRHVKFCGACVAKFANKRCGFCRVPFTEAVRIFL